MSEEIRALPAVIFNAYCRGAAWLRENGVESWPYLMKAARDYEDKTSTAMRALTAPVSDAKTREIVEWLEYRNEKHPSRSNMFALTLGHIKARASEIAALRAERDEISAKKTLQFQKMDAACEKLATERDALREALGNLIGELDDLIGESHGVYGLHLNGDPSPWPEIVEGGRFERLTSLEAARAALAPPAQASAPGPMNNEEQQS